MRVASRLRPAFAAAVLALAVLAFAQVRSVTMQVAEAAGRDCGMSVAAMAEMPGMGATAPTAQGKSKPAACPYCAAAAHAPLLAQGLDIRVPTAVAWTPVPAAAPPPARGPPPPAPRARGPPYAPLTA